ncbi:hypothetical protein NLG97_g8239 [Lecanicillium saksenae]|uniref:Uncharacterized protein n=1 Tax=Lecanicillium saksenae TaxID=468837 RepID=A0ACC1QLE8_9HYPO|nr:hypothetical protein NLG97_g8239 [Lecanicillium saksenae]
MFVLLCAALAFGRLAASLNISSVTNCTTANATTDFDFAHVNSTGVFNFTVDKITGDKPWYYHLLLADSNGQQEIGRFLMLPESALGDNTQNFTQLCAYALDGVFDSPKDGRGNQTCDGIVPEQCTEGLFHGVDFGPGGDCYTSNLNQYCGANGWHTSCMDVPDGYLVADLGVARSLHIADAAHTAYDKYVLNSRPLVLEFVDYSDLGPYSYTVDFVDALRLCGAPGEVKTGSRVPTPPKSESTSDPASEGVKQQASLLGAVALAAIWLL